jgi:hypothetical protein
MVMLSSPEFCIRACYPKSTFWMILKRLERINAAADQIGLIDESAAGGHS